MFIRHLTGPRKGQEEDVAFLAAKSLIEQGLAVAAYSDTLAPQVRSERIDFAKPAAAEVKVNPTFRKRAR